LSNDEKAAFPALTERQNNVATVHYALHGNAKLKKDFTAEFANVQFEDREYAKQMRCIAKPQTPKRAFPVQSGFAAWKAGRL